MNEVIDVRKIIKLGFWGFLQKKKKKKKKKKNGKIEKIIIFVGGCQTVL